MRHNDIDLQTACEASGHSLGLAVYCKPHPPHPSISGIYRGGSTHLECTHEEVQPCFLGSSSSAVVDSLPICPTGGR